MNGPQFDHGMLYVCFYFIFILKGFRKKQNIGKRRLSFYLQFLEVTAHYCNSIFKNKKWTA